MSDKEMFIELEGNIYVVEKEDGKVTSRAVLDGNVVLNVLMQCLTIGLPAFIAKFGTYAAAKASQAKSVKPKKSVKKKPRAKK